MNAPACLAEEKVWWGLEQVRVSETPVTGTRSRIFWIGVSGANSVTPLLTVDRTRDHPILANGVGGIPRIPGEFSGRGKKRLTV
jgi:hypothetical protein